MFRDANPKSGIATRHLHDTPYTAHHARHARRTPHTDRVNTTMARTTRHGPLFKQRDASQQCHAHEVEDEQSGDDPDDGGNLLGLLLAGHHDAVRDEAACNAVGNRIRVRHEHGGEKRRDGLVDVIPGDFLEAGCHHAADDDEHACSCGARHGRDER